LIPPLFIRTPIARGGPALRRVNPEAIAYAKTAGGFEAVYPEGVKQLRALAPTEMGAEEFVESTGLPRDLIYPDVKTPAGGRLWWAAAALGLLAGALVGGPIGALAGTTAGGAAGWLLRGGTP
jgi:hypothetical protein